MKFVDYKCPNCGGSIKFEKGLDTGTCENCGATLRAKSETTDKIFRAFDLISIRKFISAKALLEDVLSVEVENGQAYFGLLLCDTECSTPTALAKTKYAFADNPNYKRALDFLSYDQKRELMMLCNQNQEYRRFVLQSENDKSNVSMRTTDLMKELVALSEKSIGNNSLFGIYSSFVFMVEHDMELKEEVIIPIFLHTREDIERMIFVYGELSDCEKKNLKGFDIGLFEKIIDLYEQIKEVVDSISKDEIRAIVQRAMDKQKKHSSDDDE